MYADQIVALLLVLCWWHKVQSMTLGGRKSYEELRAAIVDAENGYGLGGKVFLNFDELRADRALRAMKKDELETPDRTLPAAGMHFFDAKSLIERSAVFEVLQSMPKGAVLHLHNSAAVSSKWVIKNLTYRHEARLCNIEDRYYFTVRTHKNCPENQTRLIQTMRKEHQHDMDAFDGWLESLINMKMKPTRNRSASTDELWFDFESCFDAIKGFLQHKPFFEAYHRQLLDEFHTDNVCYIELRMSFSKVFDADGKEYGPMEVAQLLHRIVDDFRQQHESFLGVKLILTKHKNMSDVELEKALKLYESLRCLAWCATCETIQPAFMSLKIYPSPSLAMIQDFGTRKV
uniref:Adenosine/AMP deaminase N-terminal domain-containing protein n=1 Tax=Anopheles farauti TaxID=69004 RepID=A0A182Q6K7_9DIPT